MRQPYVSPAVIEYGSIADCTFVTPAVAKKTGLPIIYFDKMGTDGDYYCDTNPERVHSRSGDPSLGIEEGGKNYMSMQCDKFGEYSHGEGAGS